MRQTHQTRHVHQQTNAHRTPALLNSNYNPVAKMKDVEDFDRVFQGLYYKDGLVQEIQSFRTALGGRTFFERLLMLLKIKGNFFTSILLNKRSHDARSQQDVPAKVAPATPRAPPAHHHRRNHTTQQALPRLLSAQRPVRATP